MNEINKEWIRGLKILINYIIILMLGYLTFVFIENIIAVQIILVLLILYFLIILVKSYSISY